jgi:SAM-dependent methyltransferase
MTPGPGEPVVHRTSSWLTTQHDAGLDAFGADDLVYEDGGAPRRLTKEHFEYLVRMLKILRWLDRLSFESFIDLGAGSGFLPALVRERYGVDSYYADLVHRLNLPGNGERLGRLDHAVTLDLGRLPFRDGAFDVVVSSEVLEHLVHPVDALAEMVRVARRAVVLTSLEALAPDRLRRMLSHFAVDVRRPHVERNFFLIDDFRALLGPDLRYEALLSYDRSPVNPSWPRARIDATFAAIRDRSTLEDALARAAETVPHGPGTMGIVLARTAPGVEVAPPRPESDLTLARWLVNEVASLEYYSFAALCAHGLLRVRPELAPPGPTVDRPVAPALRARLQCPDCLGALSQDAAALRCAGCGASFPTEYGVPNLHPTRTRDDRAAREQAVGLLCGDDGARAAAVVRLMERLRRNERPPGALKRAAWRVERALGSPLRRRGLWPDA